MITDRELTFSKNQIITATAVSTDSVALDGLYLGRQDSMLRVYALATTTFLAAGAATLTIEVIQATDGALTTSIDSLATSIAIPKANLVAGGKAFEFEIPMPKNTKGFVGARYTVGTGPFTAGAITMGIVVNTPTALDDRATFYTGRGA